MPKKSYHNNRKLTGKRKAQNGIVLFSNLILYINMPFWQYYVHGGKLKYIPLKYLFGKIRYTLYSIRVHRKEKFLKFG